MAMYCSGEFGQQDYATGQQRSMRRMGNALGEVIIDRPCVGMQRSGKRPKRHGPMGPCSGGRARGTVATTKAEPPQAAKAQVRVAKRQRTYQNNGAGNGIRTRDFDLGKVALYH